MNWLAKMQYRYGRKAPRNLMLVVAGGQIAAWLVIMLVNSNVYYLLQLTRSGLAHLQLWRLVSFVFSPSLTMNPLFFRAGGLPRLLDRNLAGAGLGGLHLRRLLPAGHGGGLGGLPAHRLGQQRSAVLLPLLLAFAWLFPDMQLMLFFVLPVKVKWLGWIAGGLYVLQVAFLLIAFQFTQALATVLGLANFLIFFGPDIFRRLKNDAETRRRRREWENQWRGR